MAHYRLTDLALQQRLDKIESENGHSFSSQLNERAQTAFDNTPCLGAIRVSLKLPIKNDESRKSYTARLTLDIPKILVERLDTDLWYWYPANCLRPTRESPLYLESDDGTRHFGLFHKNNFWSIDSNGNPSRIDNVKKFAYIEDRLEQLEFSKGHV